MHAGELDIDETLVRRLLSAQFPDWARLPIRPVESSGTDNAIFRLGADKAVRLPRVPQAVAGLKKELAWLAKLAPHLPLSVPVPLLGGKPDHDYPFPWYVYRWLPGHNAIEERMDELQAAADLAQFILALRRVDPDAGLAHQDPWSGRGGPLATRDAETRAAIVALEGLVDTRAVTAAWQDALAATAWDGPPLLLHGDLEKGNLLVEDGRLCGVLDFGCLGVGDPAVDVMPAWSLFSGESRERFRQALAVDNATWARGRGWALSTALIALPYYLHTNAFMVANARHKIEQVLSDAQSSS